MNGLFYLNYMSDYNSQYKIGIENLEAASIPIRELGMGKYEYVSDLTVLCASELKPGSYDSIHLEQDSSFYLYRKEAKTKEPKYKVPVECESTLLLLNSNKEPDIER